MQTGLDYAGGKEGAMQTAVIIVAAGRGSRMGGEVPKQWQMLAGKPVLEGGLVNSALGSMYAYTIQGETSRTCAGFPPIVTPPP